MNFGANLRINRYGWFTVGFIIFLIIYLRSDSSTSEEKSTAELVNLKTLLKAGIAAAERGGAAAVRARDNLTIGSKGKTKEGANDPVTNADLASNCAMVGGLMQAFPHVRVVSEENMKEECGLQENLSIDYSEQINLLNDEFVQASDVTVFVDPLDATQEFTEHLDEYVTTMVCVAVRGVPIIGVIHSPFSKRTSWAWLTKLTSPDLSKAAHTGHNREAPRVIVSRSHPGEVEKYTHEKLGQAASLEHAGGAGYKVLSVARGKSDVYLHTTAIKKWDICAGNAIISTLGGNMTTLEGKTILYSALDDFTNSQGLLVTLTHHDYYLDLIKKNSG